MSDILKQIIADKKIHREIKGSDPFIFPPSQRVFAVSINASSAFQDQKADFVTAYIADSDRTLEMIRKSPKWI